MNRIKMFTHTDLDGVGCAILAYLTFGRENVDVEYCDYKDVDEKIEKSIKEEKLLQNYRHVYITDISVSEKIADLIDFNDILNDKVKLFDHHSTAEWLNKYEWCTVSKFAPDVDRQLTSGTELFYLYLQEHRVFVSKGIILMYENIAEFVRIVRDYDTWRWPRLSEKEGVVCKKLNDLFCIYGRDDFIDWVMERVTFCNHKFPLFEIDDLVALIQRQKEIDIYVEEKNKTLLERCDEAGHVYGAVFADRYFSELGNRLSEMHPEWDYIAIVDLSEGKIHFRTVHDDVDLGELAATYFGGGGHRKAARGEFDSVKARKAIIDWLI